MVSNENPTSNPKSHNINFSILQNQILYVSMSRCLSLRSRMVMMIGSKKKESLVVAFFRVN